MNYRVDLLSLVLSELSTAISANR